MTKYLLYGLLFYLATINLIAFLLYGIDKWKARHDKWRVTEARLLSISLLGGSLGAFLGMKVLPLILILHLAIGIAVVYFAIFTDKNNGLEL